MKTIYATVRDETSECMTHGGVRRRGGFAVIVNSREVWTENDTWQPLSEAKRLCELLAKLLNKAHAAPKNKGTAK